ncbi:MAG: hexitol phosphatase HxpB [Pyrinomonadaceae bacterium]
MIRAVIFDMDGVLIDSEPLWQEAEIVAFKRVGLQLSRQMCMQTMGMRVDEVVEFWHRRHPWESIPKREIEACIIDEVVAMILRKGEAMTGVAEALRFVKGLGLKTALASSSAARIMRAVMEKLALHDAFDFVHSAEEEEYGKPHPAVYLTTARKLGVAPTECLAVEDSLNGVIAAKSARMKCIAIPEAESRGDSRFTIADATLDSLAEINMELWNRLQA